MIFVKYILTFIYRTGFDEKGSDGPYLSKQQKCTGRKDEKDIVERFLP